MYRLLIKLNITLEVVPGSDLRDSKKLKLLSFHKTLSFIRARFKGYQKVKASELSQDIVKVIHTQH